MRLSLRQIANWVGLALTFIVPLVVRLLLTDPGSAVSKPVAKPASPPL
ncbi:hypothetical protein [Bradyrhizobium australiense]|uniref:Uncharacterized protein n=1 Tax=Bradyrhizobium australiense TaxID=2721161 RepID=A0A7Y4GQF4_9BRAD|nr:hypothetical protein [Bradyrhizobium australiense]NOJ40085.1 hypothetical protein [Bradyrhizobium australiense]